MSDYSRPPIDPVIDPDEVKILQTDFLDGVLHGDRALRAKYYAEWPMWVKEHMPTLKTERLVTDMALGEKDPVAMNTVVQGVHVARQEAEDQALRVRAFANADLPSVPTYTAWASQEFGEIDETYRTLAPRIEDRMRITSIRARRFPNSRKQHRYPLHITGSLIDDGGYPDPTAPLHRTKTALVNSMMFGSI